MHGETVKFISHLI